MGNRFYVAQRYWFHLIFWLAYLGLETYFEFAWIYTSFKHFPQWKTFSIALISEASLLPHKIILTYSIFWILARKEKQQQTWFWTILGMLGLFGLAIIWQRFLVVYWILAFVYAGAPETQHLFDINRINSTMGDLLFVLGLAVAVKQYRTSQRMKEQEKNLVKAKLTAELQFLRNQTNPHFLFNTLNNIYALARKKSDETPEVVMKLSQLLRFMLYECKQEEISLANEIKVIEDYISLEKIRYQNRLQVDFEQVIDSHFELIAPLILLPFVENAFKHGVGESRFEAYIHLKLQLQAGILDFWVENSKENSGIELKQNIGLTNVRRQLELTYQDFDLKIENLTEKFKVHLHLNLRTKINI